MGKCTCPHSPACRDIAGTKMTAPEVVSALNTRACRQDLGRALAVVCSYVEHKLGKKSTSGVVFKLESLERCLPQYAETFLAIRAAYSLPPSRVLKGMGVRSRRRLEPAVAVVRVASRNPDPELPAYSSNDPDPLATGRLVQELAFWAEVESWGAVPAVVEESWGAPPAFGAPPAKVLA